MFFPDSPVQAHWLSDEDKILAVKRVAEGKTGVKNTKFKMYQVRLSLIYTNEHVPLISLSRLSKL